MGKRWRPRRSRRRLIHEFLESRWLLAGLSDSAWQNPLLPTDLDGNGIVTPSDAIAAINALNGGHSGDLAGRFAPAALHGRVGDAAREFLDASGDGKLTPLDPILVINALNSRRGPGSPIDDLPDEDQQPGDIDDPGVPELEIGPGGAKVRARLNEPGDVDVFRVVPTKGQLSVALFAPRGVAITIAILDDAGAEIGSATTTDESSKRLARVHVDVTAGETYFLSVSGGTGVAGLYGLHVLNFDEREFKPRTDAELGNDIHGDEASLEDSVPEGERATELALTGRHAQVRSNIDTADDRDVFAVDADNGKLIIEAAAEFALLVEVLDAEGDVVETKEFPDHRPLIVNVAAGAYFVAVSAANGASTGAYRMHVVNAAIPDAGEDEPVDPSDPSNDPLIPAAVERLFERIDANGDGVVTELEIDAARPPVLKFDPLDDIFAQWNINGDEGLSLDELTAGLAKLRPDRLHNPSEERRPLLSRVFG